MFVYVFDSVREKLKRSMEQLEKLRMVGDQQNTTHEGTSVFNECHNKWMATLSDSLKNDHLIHDSAP